PVVLRRPVPDELLDHLQLHALRPIRHELLARQTRRGDATAQFLQRLVRNVNVEGTNLRAARLLGRGSHVSLLSSATARSPILRLRVAPVKTAVHTSVRRGSGRAFASPSGCFQTLSGGTIGEEAGPPLPAGANARAQA